MATTGPYIMYKSSQLCAAVRSNVDLNKTLRKRIQKVTFYFDCVDTLPPRLNLKSLTTAVNVVCQQVRKKRIKFLLNRRELRGGSNELREQYFSDKKDGNEGSHGDSIAETPASDFCLLSASGYRWDNERITDYELYRCKREIRVDMKKGDKINHEWEQFINEKLLEVWRRPVDSCGLYEYKVFGTFFDINASAFFKIQLSEIEAVTKENERPALAKIPRKPQVDNEYRLLWDQFVLKLDVVDTDPDSGSEVLHWVTKFPYPLRSRDYVFVRRGKVDHYSMSMILMSRATTHPLCPENGDHVRVASYNSSMVILPHRTFDENGFDFVLSYFDDPKTNFPSYCMNVLTSSNLPAFINTLHNAAVGLSEQEERSPTLPGY